MKLTKSEMNLENLESSSAYDGAMIGDFLLFQANTNIPHKQSVPLIQKVVQRCNSQPDLLDALKRISDIEDKRYTHGGFDLEVNNISKDAIAKAEKA